MLTYIVQIFTTNKTHLKKNGVFVIDFGLVTRVLFSYFYRFVIQIIDITLT